jgi:phage gpG-like protein
MKLEVEGADKFDRALKLLDDSLTDFRRAWPAVARVFWDAEREQFDSEGSRADGWAPLSPGYQKWKAVKFPGKPILHATGELRRSLTDPFAPHAVFRMTPDSMTVGSSLARAEKHQRGEGKMPARPPVDLTDQDRLKMRDAARESFARHALELGFQVVGFGGFA